MHTGFTPKDITSKKGNESMSTHVLKIVFAILVALRMTAAAAEMQSEGPKSASPKADRQLAERGKYLVKIAGCNDCHTPGYTFASGKVPESQWLVGDTLGWRGPWGTTYPVNLRLYMRDISEAQWVKIAKTKEMRPPMPWFALRDMTERDLKSIYHYVRTLEPSGKPAPVFVPPGKEPQGPYVQFPAPPK
jgi:mono/diheme cytochrome c family protein